MVKLTYREGNTEVTVEAGTALEARSELRNALRMLMPWRIVDAKCVPMEEVNYGPQETGRSVEAAPGGGLEDRGAGVSGQEEGTEATQGQEGA